MTIEYISQKTFDRIKKIKEEHPALTFENKGYEYPNQSEWTEADKKAFNEITEILKTCIKGFSSFNNFRGTDRIQLRFQYDWNWELRNPTVKTNFPNRGSFIGVGYLYADELLELKTNESKNN